MGEPESAALTFQREQVNKIVVARAKCLREAAKKHVLDEDDFTDALEGIIRRDFFPDIALLDAQHALLDALEAGDQIAASAAYARLVPSAAVPPQRKPRKAARRSVADTPGAASLASGWEAATPRSTCGLYEDEADAAGAPGAPFASHSGLSATAAASSADPADPAAPAAPATSDVSSRPAAGLDAFLARHTSEDNASFAVVLAKDVAERKRSHWWAEDQPKALTMGAPIRAALMPPPPPPPALPAPEARTPRPLESLLATIGDAETAAQSVTSGSKGGASSSSSSRVLTTATGTALVAAHDGGVLSSGGGGGAAHHASHGDGNGNGDAPIGGEGRVLAPSGCVDDSSARSVRSIVAAASSSSFSSAIVGGDGDGDGGGGGGGGSSSVVVHGGGAAGGGAGGGEVTVAGGVSHPDRPYAKRGSIYYDERPSHLDTGSFTHRNALMFPPATPPNPTYPYGPGPKPAVSHSNTRFSPAAAGDAGGGGGLGAHHGGILDAAAGAQAIARLSAATAGGATGGSHTLNDALRGYSLVESTPDVSIGNETAEAGDGGGGVVRGAGAGAGAGASLASPLITWGTLLGTPMRLTEDEFGSSGRLQYAGASVHQPFKIPELPPRDSQLHKLANDAGQRLRARTPGVGGVPGGGVVGGANPGGNGGGRGGSAVATAGGRHASASHKGGGTAGGLGSSSSRTPQLSAAAQRLAKSLNQLNGVTGSTDVALRQSYSAKPSPRVTPRPTPRMTPRATPTPGGASAVASAVWPASIKPSPLLLRPGGGGAPKAALPAADAATGPAAVGGLAKGVTDGLLRFESIRGGDPGS